MWRVDVARQDGGELPAPHVSLLFCLPPCLRAALLVRLARRPNDGKEASPSLWRYLSIEAPLGSAAAAPNASAAASILAGQRACGSHVGRLLVGLPSWAAHAHAVPELMPHSHASPPTSPMKHALSDRHARPSLAAPKTPQPATPKPAHPTTPQLWPAAPSSPLLPYEIPRPAATVWSPLPDPAPAPEPAPWSAGPQLTSAPPPAPLPAPPPAPPPAARPPRPPESSERQVAVMHASDAWHLDSRTPTPPQPLLAPPALAGGGGAVRAMSAGIHADNLSWGASFLLATSSAAANAGPPRRTGGGAAAGSVLGWSPLQAPAYLLQQPHLQFVHVQYTEPPRQRLLAGLLARSPLPTYAASPPPHSTSAAPDAPDAPDASLPAQASEGEEQGLREGESGPLQTPAIALSVTQPTSDYTGLYEGVYVPPGLGGSASAPVLPSELPLSEGDALAGAASSSDLPAWSLTSVPEQEGGAGGGAGGGALPPSRPESPQDPRYSGAGIVELVADGYVLSLQELAELRQLAARGGGPLRQRTRGKDGGRNARRPNTEPRTFALQATLMGGREEVPGKSWFPVPGKGTFLLSQRSGAPSLGGGAPSRVRQSVDVLRREMEVQGASTRREKTQNLQRLDLIRE